MNRWDAYISLGYNCYTRRAIDSLRGASLPFDNCRIHMRDVFALTVNGFEGFFDREKIRIDLPHDYDLAQDKTMEHAKYIRRIERFQSIVKSGGKMLFIRNWAYSTEYDFIAGISEEYKYIQKFLSFVRKSSPEAKLLFIPGNNPTLTKRFFDNFHNGTLFSDNWTAEYIQNRLLHLIKQAKGNSQSADVLAYKKLVQKTFLL